MHVFIRIYYYECWSTCVFKCINKYTIYIYIYIYIFLCVEIPIYLYTYALIPTRLHLHISMFLCEYFYSCTYQSG